MDIEQQRKILEWAEAVLSLPPALRPDFVQQIQQPMRDALLELLNNCAPLEIAEIRLGDETVTHEGKKSTR